MAEEPAPVPAQPAPDSRGQSPPQGFAAHMEAIQSALAQWLSVKVDLYRAQARRLVVVVAAAIVGLVVGITILVTASALLVQGVAGGIGHWAGDRIWLGQILAPLLLCGSVLLVAWIVSRRAASRRIRALKEKHRCAEGENQPVQVRVVATSSGHDRD